MNQVDSTIKEDVGCPGFWLAVGFLCFLFALGVYDVYAVFFLPEERTVSHYLRLWSERVPVLPLVVGIVIGHIFFPLHRKG